MKNTLPVLLIALAYFLAVTVIGFNTFIWLDESFTLNTTMHGSFEAIKRAVVFEGQPILYFFSLSVWRSFNDSIFFARLFSILFATFSIPLFYNYIKTKKQISKPVLLTFLYAFNPLLIWAGMEIRVYAMVLFFSLLLFTLFEKIYLTKSNSIPFGKRLLFVAVSILSIHTHYYLAFLLFINFIYLLINNRKVAFTYLVDMILPVLSLIPYVLSFSDQVSSHSVFKIEGIKDFTLYWFRYLRVFYIPIQQIFSSNALNLLVIILVPILIATGIRHQLKRVFKLLFSEGSYPVTLLISMVVIANVLLFKLGQASISHRHIIYMLIPSLLVFYMLVFQVTNKTLRTIILTIMVGINFGNIYSKSPDFGKDADLIKISNYISEDGSKDIPIAFYPGEIQLGYEFINRDTNLYSIPKPIDLTTVYDHPDWFIKDHKDIELFFAKIAYSDTLWLIDNAVNPLSESLTEKRFNTSLNFQLLENYIDENYITLLNHNYGDNYRVRKLVKKD